MGVENYVATMRLTPITDGDRTFVEWTAEFDCPLEREAELVSNIGSGVFQGGFDALKRQFGDEAVIRIVRSTVIEAPTDRVWALLRDFNGHDRWHPRSKSAIQRGQSADKLGCVRRFFLRDGSELRERLLTLSDLEQTFSYCLMETPVPLFNYVAHVRLAPDSEGDRTFWEWRCSFSTRTGEEEDMTPWSATTL